MLSNAQLKRLQSLKLKKYRQNYAEFIIEGDKLITEALLENIPLKLICAEKQWIGLHRHAIPGTVKVEELSSKQLEKISSLTTPQQAVAVVPFFDEVTIKPPLNDEWTLVLDHIQDPGNLGTIIRSADWFGIKKIVCSQNCVEHYNPKVIQASMGSIFRVQVNYGDIYAYLKNTTVKKFGATLDGKLLSKVKFPVGGVIVIGSESHGISEKVLSACDESITIGKKGKAESLNAAVATGIILHEVSAGR